MRQAQLNNESTMQQRETCVLLRLGTEPQEALRQQRAHMVHEQHQLVQEGEAQISFVLRCMESEQRASLRMHESTHRNVTFFVRKHDISETHVKDPNTLHVQNDLAPWHSDQTHRIDPKSYSELPAVVTDVLEDQYRNSLMAQQEKGPVKDRAIPVAPVKKKGDGKAEIANSGHQTARPQEAQNVRSNTRIKVEGRKKETSDIGRQVRQKRQPLRTQKSATGQAQACQEKKVDFFVLSCKKGSCLKDQLFFRLLAPSVLHLSKKRTVQMRYEWSLRPHQQIGPKHDKKVRT